MKTVRLVAKSILINQDGKILILTRSDTDLIRPGELDLPGGLVEPGESYQEGAKREIKEEIGLDIAPRDLHLVYTETSYYDDKTTIRCVYAAALGKTPKIVLSDEHSDYAWLPLDVIKEKYSHPVYVKGIVFAQQHDLLPAKIV